MERATPTLSARVLRQFIRGIDACLRRRLGIVEFERATDALLRIAVGRAEREIVLGDGTRVRRNDPVLELHFWNEHLLALPRSGATLGWGAATRRQVAQSLRRLAECVQAAPELADIKALRIRPAFASRNLARNLSWIVARYGFESVVDDRKQRAASDAHRLLDSLWVWLLTWAYNPHSLRGHRFRRTRQEFWISRARFIALYGESSGTGPEKPRAPRQSIAAR